MESKYRIHQEEEETAKQKGRKGVLFLFSQTFISIEDEFQDFVCDQVDCSKTEDEPDLGKGKCVEVKDCADDWDKWQCQGERGEEDDGAREGFGKFRRFPNRTLRTEREYNRELGKHREDKPARPHQSDVVRTEDVEENEIKRRTE